MKKILFVCLGNICRSPAAEGVFTDLVEKKGLSSQFQIDSAGTSGHHAGEPADARMIEHAQKRGFDLQSLSRPFRSPQDFENFHYIVVMDESNYSNVIHLARDERDKEKVVMMTSYCRHHKIDHVPDPYFGGASGFEQVLDLLEDACEGLLEHVIKDK